MRKPATRIGPALSVLGGGRPSNAATQQSFGTRLGGPRPRELLGGAILVACAVGVGILASVASIVLTLGACVCGLFLLGLVTIRRASPRITHTIRAEHADEDTEPVASVEPIELRIARGFFYIGMLALGESAFRVPPGLTISEIGFIFAFALAVLAMLRGAPVSPLPIPILMAVGVFAVGGAISSLGAQSPPNSTVELFHAIYVLLLWPWVGVMVVRSRRHLLVVFSLWAISGALDGLGALAQVAGAHLPGTVAEVGRFEGFTAHPNDLGGVTGIALVPALIFATRGGQTRVAVALRWLVVALVVAGLVLSGSVGGMAGAVLALLVWLSSPAVRSSSRIVVAIAALCAAGVLGLAGARVTSPVQRLTQITSSTGSAHDRLSDAEAAWQRIKHNPIVGKGLDTPDTGVVIISQGYSVPYQVHGLPIAAWYETGIFGLAGLLGLLGCSAVLGWRTVRRSRSPDQQIITWGLLGTFGAFLVEVMTEPLYFQGYDWIVAVVLVAWSAVVFSSEQASQPLTVHPDTAWFRGGGGPALGIARHERSLFVAQARARQDRWTRGT